MHADVAQHQILDMNEGDRIGQFFPVPTEYSVLLDSQALMNIENSGICIEFPSIRHDLEV